jgi:nucleoside-diphosphate-sugar epimerase
VRQSPGMKNSSISTPRPEEAVRGRRVLVTGAFGFLGQHLVQRLLDCECVVHITSRKVRTSPNISCHKVDLSEYDSVRQTIESARPEIIYHLSSPPDAPPRIAEDGIYYRAIILGTHNLLTAAAGLDNIRIIMAGTGKEYGLAPNTSPYQVLRFLETNPTLPTTPYALCKLTATLMGQMYSRFLGIPIVTLRLFSLYGPGLDANSLIVQAIRAALSGASIPITPGQQRRDLLYVSDAVDGFVKAACSSIGLGQIINLCSGEHIRIQELVEMIYKFVGTPSSPQVGAIPYRREEIWCLCGDPSFAKKIMRWEPHVGLEEGLRKTIEWYRVHNGSIDSER